MLKKFPRFIIVDNDIVSVLLYSRIIKNILGEVDLITFEIASTSLEYIIAEYSNNRHDYAVLFLEIDASETKSWEFLEHFENLEKKVRTRVRIIVLSSSFDVRIKEKALRNKNVFQFLHKPITREFLEGMFLHSLTDN